MPKYVITIVAMVCITILSGLALYKGQDGVLLASTIGVIGGLGGFMVGKKTS